MWKGRWLARTVRKAPCKNLHGRRHILPAAAATVESEIVRGAVVLWTEYGVDFVSNLPRTYVACRLLHSS